MSPGIFINIRKFHDTIGGKQMSTNRIKVGEKARDFTLEDTHGNPVSLSEYEGKKNLFLIFNRGFA
jgi:peroxiredoxin